MKTILTITNQDIRPDSPQRDGDALDSREASRGVVLGHDGSVYLLKVGLYNYHKLPGGGIDEGEDKLVAFHRELLEEIGCQANSIQELGQVVEYRDEFNLKQTSYCYIAHQSGEQVSASLEEGELAEGMHGVRAASIEDAIELLENDVPANYEGEFIQMRDVAILRAAKEHLSS